MKSTAPLNQFFFSGSLFFSAGFFFLHLFLGEKKWEMETGKSISHLREFSGYILIGS